MKSKPQSNTKDSQRYTKGVEVEFKVENVVFFLLEGDAVKLQRGLTSGIDFILHQILVPLRRIPVYQFPEKTCEKKE